MDNLSIKELKSKLPSSYKYAERVVERAKENGITISERDVHCTVAGRAKMREPLVRRILELLIKESEEEISAIV